jgi:WD40 repeat protein
MSLWDMKSGELTTEFPGQKALSGLTFSPDGRLLASRGSEFVRLWNVETEALHHEIPIQNKGAAFDFSPDGASFVFVDGNVMSCRETASGKELWSVSLGHPVGSLHAFFSPDGRWVANTGVRKSIEIRNGRDGSLRGHLVGHADDQRTPPHFAFAPNGDHLISIIKSNEMIIWSIDTLSATHRVFLENAYPHRVAITPDGRTAITCGGTTWSFEGEGCLRGSDYDLHLWRLPESVWTEELRDAATWSAPAKRTSDGRGRPNTKSGRKKRKSC